MANQPAARSDVLEREYDAAVGFLIRGIVVLAGGLLMVWLFGLGGLFALQVFAAIVAALGVVVAGIGARRMALARSLPAIAINCPYCDHPNQFLREPTEDYTCEGCHRLVAYENGVPVPVRSVTCPTCKTEHKVSERTKTYTCDRCNRVLRLVDPHDPAKVVAESTDILTNYDVILTQGGRQPNDVAMALQGLLVCNLKEARARMENLPLTVVRDVPERKADAIRSRLRDLGATAVIRPTQDEAARPRRA